MRDQRKVPWRQIAKTLKVGTVLVHRAYEHGKRVAAIETKRLPRQKRQLQDDAFKRICAHLELGEEIREIARKLGCTEGTVRRVKQQLERECDKESVA
jgi:DNA-binding transcriptional regulator YhcF (GntR family)